MLTDVKIRGGIAEATAATAEMHLGLPRLQAIRALDAHPFFVSVTVAHEGHSYGRSQDHGGQTKKYWPRKAIESVRDCILKRRGQNPAKVWVGQHAENLQEGADRPGVGTIESAHMTEENGTLKTKALAYIGPEHVDTRNRISRGDLDCCSIEGQVNWENENRANGTPAVFEAIDISGIVMASSKQTPPGFPEAHIDGVIAELMPSLIGGREVAENTEKTYTLGEVGGKMLSGEIDMSQYYNTETVSKAIISGRADTNSILSLKPVKDAHEANSSEDAKELISLRSSVESGRKEITKLTGERDGFKADADKFTRTQALAGYTAGVPDKVKAQITNLNLNPQELQRLNDSTAKWEPSDSATDDKARDAELTTHVTGIVSDFDANRKMYGHAALQATPAPPKPVGTPPASPPLAPPAPPATPGAPPAANESVLGKPNITHGETPKVFGADILSKPYQDNAEPAPASPQENT